MSDNNTDYGNWISKKRVYVLFIITITLFLLILLPILLFVRLVLLIFFSVSLIGFLIILYYYVEFSKDNGKLQHQIRNITLEKLNWDGNGKAVDIGTGAGPLAINLAKKYTHSKVYGIDYWGLTWSYSKDMCEKNAKIEGVEDRVFFQRADASNLPFNNDEFDALVSSFVFHEIRSIENKNILIKEALRVLKKNRSFAIMDTFKNKRTYGNLETLKKDIFELGVKELHFSDINNELKLPRLIRIAFKNSGIFYGIK